MKIGFSLPNIGLISTAEAVTRVAQRAEALGYSSLWTIERLLYPLKLQTPYPGTPLYRRMREQGRLLHSNWDLYDTRHTVFRPARMTPRISLGETPASRASVTWYT